MMSLSAIPQLGKQLPLPPIPSAAAAHVAPHRPQLFGGLFHAIPGCFTEKGQEASLCSASLHGFSCQGGVLSCFLTGAAAEGGALGGRWVAELCSAFTSSPLPPCWEILRRAAVSRGQHFAKEPQWTHVLL